MNPRSASLLVALLIHGLLFLCLVWFIQHQNKTGGVTVEKPLALSLSEWVEEEIKPDKPEPGQVNAEKTDPLQNGVSMEARLDIVKPEKMIPPLPQKNPPEMRSNPEATDASQAKITNAATASKAAPEPAQATLAEGRTTSNDEETSSPDVGKEGKSAQQTIERDYLNQLRQQIGKEKFYPRQARHKAEEGTVKVGFVLHKNGEISDMKIVLSSGYQLLDQAALRAVKKASPFQPIPEDLGYQTWSINIPLSFTLH